GTHGGWGGGSPAPTWEREADEDEALLFKNRKGSPPRPRGRGPPQPFFLGWQTWVEKGFYRVEFACFIQKNARIRPEIQGNNRFSTQVCQPSFFLTGGGRGWP